MMYPPSYAMDATAASGGPSTVLPQILTGSPQTILSHVEELLSKAQQFSSLIEEFKKAETQLASAWSGHAADSAVKKIEDSLTSFTQIVGVIDRGAALLKQSATLITTAQTGYTSVVGSVNPTVAGLMSNPWTYSAAVALSTSSSTALKGFITSVAAVLKSLGAVNLASELSTVGQIITELEQLFGQSTPNTATTASTGTAVTAPVAPTSVASTAGLQGLAAPTATAAPTAVGSTPTSLQSGEQGLLHTPSGQLYTPDGQQLLTSTGQPAFQNYTPTALTGLTGATAAAPAVPTVPAVPTGSSATDQWLAVDPSQTAGSAVPATPTVPTVPTVDTSAVDTSAVSTSAGDITVTTTHGDVSTTVEVPVALHEQVSVTAEGTVTVG